MKYCYNCGTNLSDESMVCHKCRAPQDGFSSPESADNKPLFIKKRLLIAVATIFLIVLALAVFGNNNQLKISGDHFNFTDEEIIDYVNSNLTEIHIDSEDLDISSGNRTDYRITYDDDSGVLVLDHINDKVCNIGVAYFDDDETGFVLLSLIASEIDHDFITDIDYAAYEIVSNGIYVSSEMTILGDDGRYMLAPNEYVVELLDD